MDSNQQLNLKKVVEVFEKSWEEVFDDYRKTRIMPSYCSEADLKLYLANKLIKRLPLHYVHREFPIPFDLNLFIDDLYFVGKVKRTRKKGSCIVTDIAVVDANFTPYLFAEVKFKSVNWGFASLYEASEKKVSEEKIETSKSVLKKAIFNLEKREKYGPTKSDIQLFLSHVPELIKIIRAYEEKDMIVAGRQCIIQEFYPNLGEILESEIQKYNPPEQFKVLVKYFPIRKLGERILEKL